ncbi:hypothetical protein AVM11_03440 [Sphingomonas melonis TY]|jgi:hypothetical protein|uniref:Uncharacterized protein n=1 Tax=Sphingomonas melonis TY TaxID=621456 RepID=A0A175Y446_9SPHN|nr:MULTISPECIES: hypothetical protein [Sphingomonas]AOW22730.1 hypothetical protein BJP26_03390 [Sphingomonas melonis TY]ATI56135.1 hypothetical protein CP552_10685 [Sphingomonas melonis]KZB95341.1 hypothetical protein AVM11_03440 [Sphingomonas melonis TY]MBI0530766.1 hypothetical protein [Sphingomonas sp. TX0522]MBX8845150.1 hypothetical protein [Sphingomonas melonis]
MSLIRCETIGDCARHGIVVEVTCRGCGRRRYFVPGCLLASRDPRRRSLRLNIDLQRLGTMMRCSGGNGHVGCNTRGASVRGIHPDFLPRTPAGVPAIAWLNANDRERRRLERIARG